MGKLLAGGAGYLCGRYQPKLRQRCYRYQCRPNAAHPRHLLGYARDHLRGRRSRHHSRTTEDDPDPEQQTDYILHITVSSKTVDELAELYNFTQDQNDILHELLSDEMRPTLLALCGGIGIIEDGELCWPLPGHTYISCNFGDDDAYGNSGHRGTDIPAPEGTPILAAHSGTVIISGWNNSYGNQVLLDNGAGLSTRYAHMTQTAVTAGESVTAGQVIGYVGNTGDSTGFHLHFEVMQNGVRVNPMDMVSVR